jgi:hypothetical protein
MSWRVGTGFRLREGRVGIGVGGHSVASAGERRREMDPLVELGGVIMVGSSTLDPDTESESISISLSSSSIIAGWTGADLDWLFSWSSAVQEIHSLVDLVGW